ncbi:MAG TPA: hypothetical protein VM165_23535 [Planctomycetaceae bacterium]|nr:hypothetical protein [Planctomycetaceae bacterium]
MILQSDRELANSKHKLLILEEGHEEARHEADEHLRELTRESLMRLINQLKEEIARYEAHHAVRR